MHFFCQKICAYQKKAVLLQAFSSEMARLNAVALRTEMARLIGKALAQMAESVDALVSNTSGAIRAGSTPALGTSRECGEVRSPCERKRLTLAPFPQNLLQSFWGPIKKSQWPTPTAKVKQ